MKWILPLITASSVASGTVVATDTQLNQLNTETIQIYLLPEPFDVGGVPLINKPLNPYQAEVNRQHELIEANERLEAERLRLKKIEYEKQVADHQRLLDAVKKAKKYVGKTWYVFSGSSPEGWDCSGLARWVYLEAGVELEHSATKQGFSGVAVETPEVGDLVAFTWKNQKNAYHSGIYIGDGLVLHAGFKKGTRTAIIPLDSPSFESSDIHFRRIIATPTM